jgi:hypothetical protein
MTAGVVTRNRSSALFMVLLGVAELAAVLGSVALLSVYNEEGRYHHRHPTQQLAAVLRHLAGGALAVGLALVILLGVMLVREWRSPP